MVLVPELSPRETKMALLAAMALKASTASGVPLMPAGSSAGPTMIKSLCITRRRSTPASLAM